MTLTEFKKLEKRIAKTIKKYDDILAHTCGECDGCERLGYKRMYSQRTLKTLLDAYKKDINDLKRRIEEGIK